MAGTQAERQARKRAFREVAKSTGAQATLSYRGDRQPINAESFQDIESSAIYAPCESITSYTAKSDVNIELPTISYAEIMRRKHTIDKQFVDSPAPSQVKAFNEQLAKLNKEKMLLEKEEEVEEEEDNRARENQKPCAAHIIIEATHGTPISEISDLTRYWERRFAKMRHREMVITEDGITFDFGESAGA